MIYSDSFRTPVGRVYVYGTETVIKGIWMEDQKYFASTINDNVTVASQVVWDAMKWLEAYFLGKQPSPDEVPIEPDGSDFRKTVWKILQTIPYGETTTYGAIAKQITHDTGRISISSQAVAGAVAHNPLAILVPCHRVIAQDGSLAGYAGGLDNKIKLLELEHVDMTNIYDPREK